MNVIGQQLSRDVTLGYGPVNVTDNQFLVVVPKEDLHVYLLLCGTCVQDELCLIQALFQLHFLDGLSVRTFSVTSHNLGGEVVGWRVCYGELLLPCSVRNVDFGEVLTCEVCDEFRLGEFVANHVINQQGRKLFSIGQTACKNRNAQLPCVKTVVNLDNKLRVT